MLRAILNKSWKQHPTKPQLYGHQPPISETFHIRRTRHAGLWQGSKDEPITDVFTWVPSHGRARVGRPKELIYTGCSLEDLPEAMDDDRVKERERERVKEIRASKMTWYIYIYIYIYAFIRIQIYIYTYKSLSSCVDSTFRLYCRYHLAAPLDNIQCPYTADVSLCWSAKTGTFMWRSRYDFIFTPPALLSKSLSHFDGLWDGRRVALQQLFCRMLLPGID